MTVEEARDLAQGKLVAVSHKGVDRGDGPPPGRAAHQALAGAPAGRRPSSSAPLQRPRTKSSFFSPAGWGDGHFFGVVRVLDRVCERALLIRVALHTLRHTFASLAGDLGFSELTIAAHLGHASRGVTQRHVRIDEALRLAVDRIAEGMTDILDGKAAIRGPRGRGAR